MPRVESKLKETSFKDATPHIPQVVSDSTYKPALPLDTESKIETVPTQLNWTRDAGIPKTKEFTINILKLTVKLEEMFHTSNKLLATYPLSRFRPPGYYPIMTQDTDQESTNSDTTEIYWPIDLDNVQDQSLAKNKSCNTPHSKTNKTAKFKFNILLHGIRRRKPRYYFKCKETGCTHTFATLKGWNLHHRLHHNTLLKCANCNKTFTTPSAHRPHKNLHVPLKYVCETCGNTFPYKSTLRIHRHVHTSQRQFCCFAGSCIK